MLTNRPRTAAPDFNRHAKKVSGYHSRRQTTGSDTSDDNNKHSRRRKRDNHKKGRGGGTDDEEDDSPPKVSPEFAAALSLFQTLMAEGEGLMRKGFFSKSELAFKRALTVKRKTYKLGDKRFVDRDVIHCLLQRSNCRMQMGDPKSALEDAEEALQETLIEMTGVNYLNPGQQYDHALPMDYPKALLARADSLYALGDFELALVDYHCGSRMRPESQKFKHGVQKAIEAIQQAIGKIDAKRIRVQRERGLQKQEIREASAKKKRTLEQQELKRLDSSFNSSGKKSFSSGSGSANGGSSSSSRKHHRSKVSSAAVASQSALRSRIEKEKIFLEELSEDRVFLLNLKSDPSVMTAGSHEVGAMINTALEYLETRVEFWRRHNPTAIDEVEKRRIRPKSADVIGGKQQQQKRPATAAKKRAKSAPSKRSQDGGSAGGGSSVFELTEVEVIDKQVGGNEGENEDDDDGYVEPPSSSEGGVAVKKRKDSIRAPPPVPISAWQKPQLDMFTAEEEEEEEEEEEGNA